MGYPSDSTLVDRVIRDTMADWETASPRTQRTRLLVTLALLFGLLGMHGVGMAGSSGCGGSMAMSTMTAGPVPDANTASDPARPAVAAMLASHSCTPAPGQPTGAAWLFGLLALTVLLLGFAGLQGDPIAPALLRTPASIGPTSAGALLRRPHLNQAAHLSTAIRVLTGAPI